MISEKTISELQEKLQGKQQTTLEVKDPSGQVFTIQLSEGRAQNLINLQQNQEDPQQQRDQQGNQQNQQRRQRQWTVTEVQSQPRQQSTQQYA